MQPNVYPVNLPALEECWRTFIGQGELRREQLESFDAAVLQSWRRCMPRLNPWARPRLSPVRGMAFESILRAQADLFTIGTPAIEDIHQFIEGSDCAIILTNGSACVLALGGDAAAEANIRHMNLAEGAYWSEGQAGTTAFGLVLNSAMPAQVVGAEHYYKAFHPFVTSAAPIHDVRGRLIGTVGLVSPADKATSHTLALVMSAGRAISNQLQADWSLVEANHRLNEVHTIMSAISEGVIAWDAKGEINHVNTQVCQLLDLQPASVLGKAIGEVVELPAIIRATVARSAELRDAEVTWKVNGRTLGTLVSLRAIVDPTSKEASSYIALLRPIEQVRQLVQQQTGTHATLTLEDVYGESPAMRRVIRQARIAAQGMAPVLLRGEGGVGKNHLAQAIHNDSRRARGPFLAVNCRAIPRELMATELLGEEGGRRMRPSKFELVEGGTLLLDQVDSLTLEMQAALLQMVETGHIMRPGASQPVAVDVRVIVATTQDLERLVSEGSFLSHLYYRFGVFNILLPSLRQRSEDIPLLAHRFLARISQQSSQIVKIDEEALLALQRYPWPGNVRELESVLERALRYNEDGTIHAADLPESVREGRVLVGDSPLPQRVLSVAEAEREAIIRAGWMCQGRVGDMAQHLQISRTTLWRKMKLLSISATQFQP